MRAEQACFPTELSPSCTGRPQCFHKSWYWLFFTLSRYMEFLRNHSRNKVSINLVGVSWFPAFLGSPVGLSKFRINLEKSLIKLIHVSQALWTQRSPTSSVKSSLPKGVLNLYAYMTHRTQYWNHGLTSLHGMLGCLSEGMACGAAQGLAHSRCSVGTSHVGEWATDAQPVQIFLHWCV